MSDTIEKAADEFLDNDNLYAVHLELNCVNARPRSWWKAKLMALVSSATAGLQQENTELREQLAKETADRKRLHKAVTQAFVEHGKCREQLAERRRETLLGAADVFVGAIYLLPTLSVRIAVAAELRRMADQPAEAEQKDQSDG